MTTSRIAVVGGGISGLAIAHEIVRLAGSDPVDVTVHEAAPRPGGKIWSRKEEGYTVEWGSNGFLDSKPETLALTRLVGLNDRLLPSDDRARKRFLFVKGKLRRLPESPGAFLTSGILSWPAKFRVAWEPLARPRPEDHDETVFDFASRRIGKQAAARLVDPMVSGVFAGDPHNLSLAAAFPRMREMEDQYGGLFKAMKAIAKERREQRKAGEDAEDVSAAPAGRLTSFQAGLDELPRAVASCLGGRVRLGQSLVGLEREEGAWRLTFSDGAEQRAEVVVLATPAHASAELLAPHSERAGAVLSGIPYGRLAVVALGYPADGFSHPLDGFGFLVPSGEKRRLLGALWTSSVFPGRRAPDGRVLLRCMVGGMRAGELLDLGDDELLLLARQELQVTMGFDCEPEFSRVFRHEQAIPGYPPGHHERLAELEENLLASAPGLLLGGNAYRGIGMNDCTRNALQVAPRALDIVRGLGKGEGFLTF